MVESIPRIPFDSWIDPRGLSWASPRCSVVAPGRLPSVRFREIDSTETGAAIIDRDDKHA